MELHYKLTAAQYAHPAGTLRLVRPRVIGSLGAPYDNKPQTVPIVLNANGRWRDSFDITLPDGHTVGETPEAVNLDLDFASYRSTIATKGNQLHYERRRPTLASHSRST